MLFLLCHNIKTDIIMHIVVYLFEKVGVFCCLFWHCHGIYLSLENLGMPWYKMTVKANLCELQQLGSPKMNDWECIESSKKRFIFIILSVFFRRFSSDYEFAGAFSLKLLRKSPTTATTATSNPPDNNFQSFLCCLFFRKPLEQKIWSNKWEKWFLFMPCFCHYLHAVSAAIFFYLSLSLRGAFLSCFSYLGSLEYRTILLSF